MKILPALLPLVCVLASCAINPQGRIDRDPQAFAALPAEQQDKVRAGEIGMGYSPAAVKLALGAPDRIVERETAEGRTEVWLYLAALVAPLPSTYCTPGFRTVYAYPCPAVLPTQYEERMRVVFKDGKVTAVERAR
jgi:hypothetical protein